MPPPPAGRAPHITLPSKNVIANQSADRRGNPYTPRTALPVPRRGRRLPTVVPADSRPLSWPPIGALPRNRLASPATGGASPISPTPRRQRTASPQKSCHCEERSDVAIRPPHAPHPQPMRRGGVLPRPSPTSHPHKKPAAAQIAPLPVSVCFYLPPQKDTVSCAGFWQALMRSTYSTGPSPW